MISDVYFCFDRASVLFAIHPGRPWGPRVVCEISEDALRDVFRARGGSDDLAQACRRHFDLIEAAALRRHHQHPDAPVKLETGDFAFPPAFATDSVY